MVGRRICHVTLMLSVHRIRFLLMHAQSPEQSSGIVITSKPVNCDLIMLPRCHQSHHVGIQHVKNLNSRNHMQAINRNVKMSPKIKTKIPWGSYLQSTEHALVLHSPQKIPKVAQGSVAQAHTTKQELFSDAPTVPRSWLQPFATQW